MGQPSPQGLSARRRTRGTETSKYPEEEKSNEIPRVAASESGRDQTGGRNTTGVRTAQGTLKRNRMAWEGQPEKVIVL